MDRNALEAACFAYEARNGVESFLDTVADIVADVLARNGLPVEFDGAAEEPLGSVTIGYREDGEPHAEG